MITTIYTQRNWTAEEVSEAVKKAQAAGIPFSASSVKNKKKPVETPITNDSMTEYLQDLTEKIRASGKDGSEVKVIGFDYKSGEAKETGINPALAGKLLNAAIQVEVDLLTLEAFSATLFDEDGYFMRQASAKATDAEQNAVMLRKNIDAAIRAETERKAKDATK